MQPAMQGPQIHRMLRDAGAAVSGCLRLHCKACACGPGRCRGHCQGRCWGRRPAGLAASAGFRQFYHKDFLLSAEIW